MKKVFCPHCRRRLFDIEYTGEAYIETKCPKCGEMVKVKFAE